VDSVEDREVGRVDDVCWVNDPVPVPVPLLVVLLPLLSRGRATQRETSCMTDVNGRRTGTNAELEPDIFNDFNRP
jgi:hypothetical protein